MTERTGVTIVAIVAAGLFIGALMRPSSAAAIEVKNDLYTKHGKMESGPAPRNPLTPALRKQLAETVSYESEKYLDEESVKKSEGKLYVDIEHAKFSYVPMMKNGKVDVLAKLEAPEYRGVKEDPHSRGRATGKRKVLIFNYRLDGNKWTEVEPPKWEDATQTAAAKKK
jgi:hypothetical protein